MKRPPSPYSADGRWWWDGEQWQAVDPMLLPVPTEPPRRTRSRRALPSILPWRVQFSLPRRPRLQWPRPRPPGRPHLAAMALTLTVIVLAIGVPSPAAAMSWLPSPTSLTSPSLPALPSIRIPSFHMPSVRLPDRPSSSSSPSPRASARPTPTPPSTDDRYRAAAAAGGVQIDARIDAVDHGCTAPANLAVCRAALVSLQGSASRLRAQLDSVGTPACLGGADPELRKVLDDLDASASQAIGGIDGQDPGRIVSGTRSVDANRGPLSTALDHVHTAVC